MNMLLLWRCASVVCIMACYSTLVASSESSLRLLKRGAPQMLRSIKRADYSAECESQFGKVATHRCTSVFTCLPDSYICDGFNNCPDGSDEIGCPDKPEEPIQVVTKPPEQSGPQIPWLDPNGCGVDFDDAPYRCNYLCIRKKDFCDGFVQCEGATDELDCGYGQVDKNGCRLPDQIGKVGTGYAKLKDQILEAMNYYRCLHGVNALTWDAAAESFAEQLSKSNAAIGRLEHSGTKKYGENVAMMSVKKHSDITGYGFAKMWYDEINLYDYNNPHFAMDTGHFTQLVWKSNRIVGCSFADGKDATGLYIQYYLTCEYEGYPAGNDGDSFPQNVLPPI